MPVDQARRKASIDQCEGQDQALPPISESFLKAPRITQRMGKMTRTAHRARKPCEKRFRTWPDSAKRVCFSRGAPGVLVGSGWVVSLAVVLVCVVMSSSS